MAEQKSAYERLKEYEAQGAHMLIPSVISIGDIATGFALIVEPVFLKPHPKEKDVYPHDSDQYDSKKEDWKTPATGGELVRIHKQGFDRLAQAARVDWLPGQIIRDPTNSGRMMASIEGMIRTSTGELYRVQDIAGMDLDIEMEKLRAKYTFDGKFDAKKQWIVDRDFLQKKANQQKLCISGAKNRVIKQLLCLRNTYTVAEIGKPFVAVRIVPHLDMNDAYTRKRVVDVQIAAMAGIYGLLPSATPAPQQQIEMVGKVPDAAIDGDDNVIDAEPTGNGKPYTIDKSQTMATDDNPPFMMDPPAGDTPESRRVDFANCDEAGQCKVLTVMIGERKQAGFVSSWLKRFKQQPATIESIGAESRLRLYDYLTGEGGKAT